MLLNKLESKLNTYMRIFAMKIMNKQKKADWLSDWVSEKTETNTDVLKKIS